MNKKECQSYCRGQGSKRLEIDSRAGFHSCHLALPSLQESISAFCYIEPAAFCKGSAAKRVTQVRGSPPGLLQLNFGRSGSGSLGADSAARPASCGTRSRHAVGVTDSMTDEAMSTCLCGGNIAHHSANVNLPYSAQREFGDCPRCFKVIGVRLSNSVSSRSEDPNAAPF